MDYFISKGFGPDRKIHAEVKRDDNPFERYKSIVADIKEYFEEKEFYEISQEAYQNRDKGKQPKKISDGKRIRKEVHRRS